MSSNLGSVLDAARVGAFVGRQAELAAFESALTGRSDRRVLFAHGPGGIGKTTLLHQFRIRAQLANRPVIGLDGRDIDCSPEGFRSAFGIAVDRTCPVAAPDGASGETTLVLLLDGYDRLAPLDDWLRSDFLPSLPADSVIVLAGREPPASSWRIDPGWRALASVHRLNPLDHTESLDLLGRCAVPGRMQTRLTELGRGHPLTLALLADSAAVGEVPDNIADSPDLVATLVPRLVGEAPDDAHALGLALCAMTWLTTLDLLRSTVGGRAQQVWSWLENRPFITRGTDGLYPHELVRDVLDADLRRRSPEDYRKVHQIVHQQAVAGLRSSDTASHQLWGHQKLYLHRRSPLSGSFWVLRERGAAAVTPGRSTDHPEIIEMVRHFEGEKSSRIAARWLDAQPEGLSVIRSPSGIEGFSLQVIFPADPGLVDADPIVRAALEVAADLSPARPGEQISIARFMAGRQEYQRDAYAVLAASISSAILWISRPFAWSLVTTVDPEFWSPGFEYLGLRVVARATFDGREYTTFGIDWRRLPVDVWLTVMAERELTGEHSPIPEQLLRPAPTESHPFR